MTAKVRKKGKIRGKDTKGRLTKNVDFKGFEGYRGCYGKPVRRFRDAEAAGSNPVASTLGRGAGSLDFKDFRLFFVLAGEIYILVFAFEKVLVQFLLLLLKGYLIIQTRYICTIQRE